MRSPCLSYCLVVVGLWPTTAVPYASVSNVEQSSQSVPSDLPPGQRYGALEGGVKGVDNVLIKSVGPIRDPASSPYYVDLDQLRLTRYTRREGAPTTSTGFAQTPDGMLWIAGLPGLYRFDGLEFDSSPGDSMPETQISTLYADDAGNLWIGYTFGGIARLTNGVLRQFPGTDVPSGSVKQFSTSDDGSLFARSTTGVAQFDGQKWRILRPADGYPGYSPRWIGSYAGQFWIVDRAGTFVRSPHGPGFVLAPEGLPFISDRPKPFRIIESATRDWTIQEQLVDPSGAVWFTAPERYGRYRWRVDRQPWERLPPEFGPEADDPRDDGFLVDREGNTWVLTGKGLSQYTPTKFTPYQLPEGVPRPWFGVGPDGTVWLGAEKPGMVRSDGSFVLAPQLGDFPGCFAFDVDGSVWASADDGVRRIKADQVTLFPTEKEQAWGHNCQGIVISKGFGVLVSIAKAGLFTLRDGHWIAALTDRGLPKGPAIRVFKDDRERIWLTYPKNRIAMLDGDHTEVFTDVNGLDVGNVVSVFVHGDAVWVGGDAGVARMVNKRFESLQGRGNQRFRGISGLLLTHSGELWLNAADGVYRVSAADARNALTDASFAVSYELFGYRDGLLGGGASFRPGPSLQQSTDGVLWVGSGAGLYFIRPDRILRNHVAPVVIIRGITGGEKAYATGMPLAFPAHTQAVSVRYTAAMLTSPERVHFRYRLIGSDGDWHSAGTRRAAYFTNLDPGDYRFEVSASNEDGVESRRPAVLEFRIAPAVYQTWWFKGACILVLLASLFAFIRIQLRRSTTKVRVLLNERHAERERIARDFHDTLLQDFQGISLHLQAWSANPDVPGDVRAQLAKTAADAVNSLRNGRDKIMLLRKGEDDGVDLADAVRACGQQVVEGTDTTFDLIIAGPQRRLTSGAQEETLAIVRECIRNALNHAGSKHIQVALRFGRHLLEVLISNDGAAYAPPPSSSGANDHWGLVGMRERARVIGALFDIRTGEQGGAIAMLRIPARRAYAS